MAENNNMSIHLLFADGSNPYIRYNLTPAEFAKELLKWAKNYNLTFTETTGQTIFNFRAAAAGDPGNRAAGE